VFKLTEYKVAIEKADIIAILVAHDEFKGIEISKGKVVLDFCGIVK
jgi:UDP-N-acetyl-D-mannosaminuronic acid dehydrogenase